MRSELIILLVLASLTQGSYAPTLKITYHGLSKKQMAVLNKITDNQEAAVSLNHKGVEFFFEILCDQKAKADEDNHEYSKMVDKVENAIDISFGSLLIAMEKSCSALESAQNIINNYVYDATTRFSTSIKLAKSGNLHENCDAIEANRLEVKKFITKAIKEFYNAFYTCLHTTDAEALAVIKDAHNGSLRGLVHLTNAFFNAIKVKATKFTSRNEKSACMYHMQQFRNEALVAVSDNIEYKFSLMKTYFMYSHINQGEILHELFANQYALAASYRGYKAGNMVVFDRIIDYLRKIYPELSNDDNLDLSQDDIALRTAIDFYTSADGANFASFFVLHPDATSAIAKAQENVFNADVEAAQSFFDAIHVAATKAANYSDVTNYIAASKDAAAALTPLWIQEYVRAIRQNRIFNSEIEAEFARLVEMMTDGSLDCTYPVFDAIGVLAKATHTNEVHQDDFEAVRGFLDAANSGCGQFTQGVSAASFLVLVARDAR